VQFRFVEDPPAAGSAPADVKWSPDLGAKDAGCVGVAQRGARSRVQLAVQDLGDQVIGHLQEILVGGGFLDQPRYRHHLQDTIAGRLYAASRTTRREA
jgi:hypothetical protein